MSSETPNVSVVVVNYKGADDTIACLEGISELDWPRDRIEVVVVDNDSGGDDVARIRAAAPTARVEVAQRNLGFAGGCNLGAGLTGADYIAFVNNDARPGRDFLRAAIGALELQPEVAAVAAKVLDWSGERVDFVGSALTWYGHGIKLHAGEPDDPVFDEPRDVLFGTGSALVVRRAPFEAVGRFDERYFMFYEDVDLGWRLWLAGFRVQYVPGAVAYHRHHASMSGLGTWRERFLLERNALFTVYKNYDDGNLARVLAPALALAVRRGVLLAGADPSSLDLEVTPPMPDEPPSAEVDKILLASAYAVDAFVRELPSLAAARKAVQTTRKRGDAEITRLFEQPMVSTAGSAEFSDDLTLTSSAFGIEHAFGPRRRILVLTGDTLAPRMAGPAIRALQISRALAREHEVTLATTSTCDLERADFATTAVAGRRDMMALEKWADVIVFQGHLLQEYPFLKDSPKPIVVDMYDPFHLEQLEQARDLSEEKRREVVEAATAVLNEQILRGDFFLCASDKQRDFWLGQMAALGRLNPAVYDQDETLNSLITVVPFGLEDAPPMPTRPAVKGVLPGIGPDDKVILWGGGIYNWFDPLTLIRAMVSVRAQVPEARLLFMGVKHPNPGVPHMRMATRAGELAEQLGLLGSSVIFNYEWVPYDDRQNFLLESDVGVSTHLDHVETAFSFRTRILDYIWASLPIVCTGGDSLAALVEARGLGEVVPPDDVDAVAEALVHLLRDAEAVARCRENLAQLAPELTWSRVLEPLVRFCRDPRRAADLVGDTRPYQQASRMPGIAPPAWGGIRGDLDLVRTYLAREGARGLLERVAGRVGRLARGRLRPSRR